MNDDHPVLTTVGVATVVLGVLMVLQPGLAAAVGVDYAAVLLVGLIALVQAVRVARARQTSEIRGAETPDVEAVETVPTPGEEFDRTVATLRSGPRRVLIRDRADLREQIEEAAVTAVADRENCSPEAAEERIEVGAWTDDPHAAAFLGGADAPQPPLFDRMKLAARAESRFQHRIRRTADAVARTAGVTPDEDAGDATGDEGDGTAPGGEDGDAPGGEDGDRPEEKSPSRGESASAAPAADADSPRDRADADSPHDEADEDRRAEA